MSGGLVELLVIQGRVVAREQARLLDLVLQVVEAAPDVRFGVDEVAFAMSWTKTAAGVQEVLARQLIGGLPQVFAALAAGQIDLPKARAFAEVLQDLDPVVAGAVAAQVLAVAGGKNTACLRRMLHRRALAADPAHARKRREAGLRNRRVIVEPAVDGTATLTALGLAPQRAQAAFERVNAIAKARKLAGAGAGMDELRADVLLDLLEGVPVDAVPGPRRGVVDLIVGWNTLAGLDEQPGTLNGFGPVAADIARQCAAANLDAQWRFSVVDPDTGDLLFHGITRARPTPPPPTRNDQPPPTQPPQSQPAQAQQAGSAQAQQSQPAWAPQAEAARAQQSLPAQSQQAGSAWAPRAQWQPAQAQQAGPIPTPGQATSTRHARPQPAQAEQTRRRLEQAPQAPPAEPPPSPPAQAVPAEAVPAQAVPAQAVPAQAVPAREKQSRAEPLPQTALRPVPCPPAQDPLARFPNAATVRWIHARDRACRAPGCRVPARNCHIDHTTDYARGGTTTHDDLGPLCGRHHVMKHQGGWRLYQTRPGHFVWISPQGRVYHVGPEPP